MYVLCEFFFSSSRAIPIEMWFHSNDDQLTQLRLQQNRECKGLMVQIRYLKAKFTRESNLRYALVYQKNYLLVLLTRLEKG